MVKSVLKTLPTAKTMKRERRAVAAAIAAEQMTDDTPDPPSTTKDISPTFGLDDVEIFPSICISRKSNTPIQTTTKINPAPTMPNPKSSTAPPP